MTLTPVSPALAEAGRAVSERLLAEQRAEALKQAAVAMSDALDWSAEARRPSHAELMRRRYPPTGDPDLWVRYGPDGPPEGVDV